MRLENKSVGLKALVIAVGLIVLSVVFVAAASGSKTPSDPYANMSDAQKAQAIQSSRAQFEARYENWLASLDLSKIPYRSLKHLDELGLYDPPAPSFVDATARADVIVLGTVRSIRPTTFDGSYATLDIKRAIKSSPATTLVVHQGGGLRPTADWKGMFIADAPAAPLLLPGDRVMVFLQHGAEGKLDIQAFSGLYHLESGRVASVRGNPFAAQIDGKSESAFISVIQGALARL
jgi:hypothetical protein